MGVYISPAERVLEGARRPGNSNGYPEVVLRPHPDSDFADGIQWTYSSWMGVLADLGIGEVDCEFGSMHVPFLRMAASRSLWLEPRRRAALVRLMDRCDEIGTEWICWS